MSEERIQKMEAALRLAQKVLGSATSLEAKQPRYDTGWYETPRSDGDNLRIEAARADERDRAIVAIREALALLPPDPPNNT
jgi:hypothetical protein